MAELNILYVITLFGMLVYVCRGVPVTNTQQAMNFLKKYGYIGAKSPDPAMQDMSDDEAMKPAVMQYQHMMGMNATGNLDHSVMDMMSQPRCGNPDMTSMRDMMKRRKKRYSISLSRWLVNPLYYKFINYSPDLDKAVIEDTVRRAFGAWAAASPLKFEQVSENELADIDISFAPNDHASIDEETKNIDEAFDGPGGTLAHAFFPQHGGNAHFDDSETFTVEDPNGGIDLYFVAIHELGHSLGLGHSDDRDAIMYPIYRGFVPNLRLNVDDISGIQALYGSIANTLSASASSTTTPLTTTSNKPSPDKGAFCNRGTLDAITPWQGQTYAFQGDLFVVLDDNGILPGYPMRIADYWPELPGDLDAALDFRGTDTLYFFKGTECWSYIPDPDGRPFLQSGYPREIRDALPGLDVEKVDAAFTWQINKRSYVFADNEYYRIHRSYNRVEYNYPRPVTPWKLTDHFPDTHDISDAFSSVSTGRTYFFSDNAFYRYNDMKFEFDPGYPQSLDAWYGCNSAAYMEMDQPRNQFNNVDGIGPAMCLSGMECEQDTSAAVALHDWPSGSLLTVLLAILLIKQLNMLY